MHPSPDLPLVLTRNEAMQLARLSKRTFDAAIKRDEFPVRRVGGRVLIPRTSFLDWLAGDVKD